MAPPPPPSLGSPAGVHCTSTTQCYVEKNTVASNNTEIPFVVGVRFGVTLTGFCTTCKTV
jgi:hypothetical protein